MRSTIFLSAFTAVTAAMLGIAARATADPFADGVYSYQAGTNAGFGQDRMPFVVLGAPRGGGAIEGGTDVLSLGDGGSVVVAFRDNVLMDGPGDDLIVYENAFHSGSESGPIFTELGFVQVSVDRKTWFEFPYDEQTGEGLAGRTPVFAAPGTGIDPLSAEAGGDRFDIADVGLEFVRFVRIIDVNRTIPDAGDFVVPADKGGFDLDAVAAIHSIDPGRIEGRVTAGGTPVPGALVTAWPATGGRKIRRRTGEDGSFAVPRLTPSGDYLVRARRRGLGRVDGVAHVDALEPNDFIELDLTTPPS